MSDLGPKIDGQRRPGETTVHLRRYLARGNRESLDWICARFTPLLHRSVRSFPIVHLRTDDVDEIVQETWIVVMQRELYKVKPTKDGKSLSKAFARVLGASARRVAWNHMRKETFRATENLDSLPPLHAETTSMISALIKSEVARRSLSFLDECLSDLDRDIFLLHAVAGFRPRDIALEKGLEAADVSNRYHRARKKVLSRAPIWLREHLESIGGA